MLKLSKFQVQAEEMAQSLRAPTVLSEFSSQFRSDTHHPRAKGSDPSGCHSPQPVSIPTDRQTHQKETIGPAPLHCAVLLRVGMLRTESN